MKTKKVIYFPLVWKHNGMLYVKKEKERQFGFPRNRVKMHSY